MPTGKNHHIDVTVRVNAGEVYGSVRSGDVQNGMDDLAGAALDMQRVLVPVDTGNLSRHLGIRNTADGTGREIGALGDIDYASHVEEGHQTEAGTWVPAQPFIRPSMDAVRRRLNDA